MKISELIAKLQDIMEDHGDMRVVKWEINNGINYIDESSIGLMRSSEEDHGDMRVVKWEINDGINYVGESSIGLMRSSEIDELVYVEAVFIK